MPSTETFATCADCLDGLRERFQAYSCGDCADSLYRCDGCDSSHYENHHDDDSYEDDDYGHDDSRIHYASWRPQLRFKGDRSEPMMGIELEVQGNAQEIVRAVRRVDSTENHLFCKTDCSVRGLEIVSHPMTLAWAREFPFGELLADLRRRGCSDPNGCGLHIHVDRQAFRKLAPRIIVPATTGRDLRGRFATPTAAVTAPQKGSATHQMMWLLFIFRNSGPLIELGRRNSTWGSFRKPEKGELAKKAKANGAAYGERYMAVNTNNEATYEMRFMKSTLSEQELMASIEFADASVRYTRDLKTPQVLKGTALKWSHFTDWVEAHGYTQLFAEITK